jgi:hypothetical protein
LSLTQVNWQVLSSYINEVRLSLTGLQNYGIVNSFLNISSLLNSNNSFRLASLNSLTNSKVESLTNSSNASFSGSIYSMNVYTFASSLFTSITFSSFQVNDLSLSTLNIGNVLNKLSLFSTLWLNTNVLAFLPTSSVQYMTKTIDSSTLLSGSNMWSTLSGAEKVAMSGEESTDSMRRQRSSSPVVGYNFKVGDFYPSTTLKFYPSVIRSLSDVTRGVRRAAWYFSPTFNDLLKENFGNYMSKVVHSSDYPVTDARSRPVSIAHNAPFYNFFYLLSNSSTWVNSRWLSVNSLDQKFYRMYMSSTMQQRIYTNW